MAHANELDTAKGNHSYKDGDGFKSAEYEHQEYPKMLYIRGEQVIAQSREDEERLLPPEVVLPSADDLDRVAEEQRLP